MRGRRGGRRPPGRLPVGYLGYDFASYFFARLLLLHGGTVIWQPTAYLS
jgi:hypothetical protein